MAARPRPTVFVEGASPGSAPIGVGDRASRVLLFVRFERTEPYLFVGPGELETATGDRPIAITWALRTALPEDVFQAARRVAG